MWSAVFSEIGVRTHRRSVITMAVVASAFTSIGGGRSVYYEIVINTDTKNII